MKHSLRTLACTVYLGVSTVLLVGFLLYIHIGCDDAIDVKKEVLQRYGGWDIYKVKNEDVYVIKLANDEYLCVEASPGRGIYYEKKAYLFNEHYVETEE